METPDLVWFVYLDRPPHHFRVAPEVGLWIRAQRGPVPSNAHYCPIIIYPASTLDAEDRDAFTLALDGDVELTDEVRTGAVNLAAEMIWSLTQDITNLRRLQDLYRSGRLKSAAIRADQRALLEGVGPKYSGEEPSELGAEIADPPYRVAQLQTESGEPVKNPSEDAILLSLGDIEEGTEQFLILSDVNDSSEQTYIQVRREPDGRLVVERRDGSPDTHYSTSAEDVHAAHRLLSAWTFGLPSPDADWHRLDLRM